METGDIVMPLRKRKPPRAAVVTSFCLAFFCDLVGPRVAAAPFADL